ncbi:hypothetical protein BT96DRAFT_922992 [Gymnopus androsaceus JB14]|uniref:Uncharacterized protein n=1 Tax=Gymnopus androsaceus JB14 TaxID=1447944 RepID=A0A6A4HC64_9AGAR|nr:hypothetical protein BT96DRAFT_922992 [Gymnopus androsaceus JB14]
MPTKYAKLITSNADLKAAMLQSLKRSLKHHAPPLSLAIPGDVTTHGRLKPVDQVSETQGYAIIEDHIEAFLLDLGVSRKTSTVFYELSLATVKDSIPEILKRIALRDGLDLSISSIKARTRSFVVLLGRGEYHSTVIRQLFNTYLDEFSHLLQRWDFLPSDDDHSPESVRRHMESFKIPAFERKEVDPPLRRSKRLSCKVAASEETALAMVSKTRLSLSGPATPLKRNRKVAFEHAAEKPEEVQIAKKRKFLRPNLKENMSASIVGPVKPDAVGVKTRRTFGVGAVMRTVTNRTTQGKKSAVA